MIAEKTANSCTAGISRLLVNKDVLFLSMTVEWLNRSRQVAEEGATDVKAV